MSPGVVCVCAYIHGIHTKANTQVQTNTLYNVHHHLVRFISRHVSIHDALASGTPISASMRITVCSSAPLSHACAARSSSATPHAKSCMQGVDGHHCMLCIPEPGPLHSFPITTTTHLNPICKACRPTLYSTRAHPRCWCFHNPSCVG